jgi:predicted aspartyl protease
MTRCLLAMASCLTLVAGDLSQLRRLEEKHRMFDVRAALGPPSGDALETQLYRAIAASRFGSEREAVEQLRSYLAEKRPPDLERKAREELSNALTRLGEYRKAADELATAFGRGSEIGDVENVRVLLESLSDVPPPAVEWGTLAPVQATRDALGLWEVPVEVNSKTGAWIFDTGANFSTVTESEARRLGLEIREVKAYARGFTQNKNSTRLAVAGEVRLGAARVRNVVFLVLPDQALNIPQAKFQINGIVGMPVMRTLGSVELSAAGVLTMDRGPGPKNAEPNVFFDGLNAIVRVVHADHGLQMMLDTGAKNTLLYPSVRQTLAQWELNQLSGSRGELGGAGGSERADGEFVPSIQLDLLGRTIYLQRLRMLAVAPLGIGEFRDGILGIDAMGGGFRLDFRTMQFALR